MVGDVKIDLLGGENHIRPVGRSAFHLDLDLLAIRGCVYVVRFSRTNVAGREAELLKVSPGDIDSMLLDRFVLRGGQPHASPLPRVSRHHSTNPIRHVAAQRLSRGGHPLGNTATACPWFFPPTGDTCPWYAEPGR